MEVHHHAHTDRKKWTHYFWEFFMLFLAVTMGFLTENIREGYQERQRVNEFMCKISHDLRADLVGITRLKQQRLKRNIQCDSLIILLSNKPATGDRSKTYYYGRYATRRIHFRPQNATLQQLKNTGDLRLVENSKVLDSINHYEQMLKYNDENVQVEEKELSDIGYLTARIFDANVFQYMMKDNKGMPPGNPPLMSYDKLLLNELSTKLHYWKRTSLSVLESFDEMIRGAESLLKLITENYHCKKSHK